MSTTETLNQIFRMVFDDDTIEILPDMTANDIDGWDSFAHLNLITAIENSFDIQIADDEVIRLKNVGDIIEIIERKSITLTDSSQI